MSARPQYMIGGFCITDRQRDVWKSIAEGESLKAIAQQFGIATKTAEYHYHELRKRLNIWTVAGLTRAAIKTKLIPL